MNNTIKEIKAQARLDVIQKNEEIDKLIKKQFGLKNAMGKNYNSDLPIFKNNSG